MTVRFFTHIPADIKLTKEKYCAFGSRKEILDFKFKQLETSEGIFTDDEYILWNLEWDKIINNMFPLEKK